MDAATADDGRRLSSRHAPSSDPRSPHEPRRRTPVTLTHAPTSRANTDDTHVNPSAQPAATTPDERLTAPAAAAETVPVGGTTPSGTPTYRPNAKYVLLLGTMCALPAISNDIYLPSLPDVARDLGTSATAAQLTMTAMMLGGAVGQLVIGPLSDRFGRRAPVLVGVALHIVTSLLCAVVTGVEMLIALRVAQGFFNASATVVAMAVIRDRFVGADASRLISRLMLVIGIAPLFAPSVGGLIAGEWGWRAVFVGLGAFGAFLWVVCWRRLPETLPAARRRDGGLRTALRGYGTLLRDRHFLALAIMPGLGNAVLMSYVIGSPFVLQEGFGLSSHEFSLLFALNGVGLVAGAQVNATLVRKVAPIRIIRVVLPASLGMTLALLVVCATGFGGLPLLLVMLWLVLALVNFAPPNASALALSRHGEIAGTAAAMIGATQASISGLISPLSGFLGGDAVAMAAVMVGSSVAALAVLALATPAYRRGGGWTG